MHPLYQRNNGNGFSTFERKALTIFITLFIISTGILLRRYYVNSTIWVPKIGGTYIEGSVGEPQPLMPWFTVTNDVNRDIVSLVFSGLLKYNPETKKIEEDLATLSVSNDATIYTVTLKDNLYWHDTAEDNPHPVTADDILFTFTSIQKPDFPNSLLQQNFQGVEIEKLSDRSVRFHLEEPYSFFSSNLTIGLLPERSFKGIPVKKLDQVLDFAFAPIGAGPYKFKSLVQTDLSTEITLERFARSIPPEFRLDRIIFRIFPDYPTLLSDIRNIDGIRLVPHTSEGEPIIPRNFRANNYVLPQYVALFLNLSRPILQDRNLRLGLQLGTNKQEIVEEIGESMIVDTPLLEIDQSDWRYKFDPESAQGAFFSSNWHLPEKVRLQRLLEKREANDFGVLHINPIVLLDTGAVLTITGSWIDVQSGATVNNIPVVQHPSESGSWIVAIPTHGGTGALQLGDNLVRLEIPNGSIVDSFYVWRTAKPKFFKRAAEEQRLLELFMKSRVGDVPAEDRITAADLYLEGGMLRRRLPSDPVDIRVNDWGDRLSLILVTSPTPSKYETIAKRIKQHWEKLGVHVAIEIPETRDAFEQRLLARDYDVLLFGQSLLDNLDSYPYWHSSGMQRLEGSMHELQIDAYNLSQYSSLEADALLEVIRETSDEEERQTSLQELKEVLKNDVPAVFLYSPLYTFAYHKDLHGINIQDLSLHSDRFLTLHHWFTQQERVFKAGKSWWSFFPWLFTAWRD